MAETYFGTELRRLQGNLKLKGRRWIYIPYDQVTDALGPLSHEDAQNLGIVLVENPWKASRRGIAIRHLLIRGPYRTALEPLIKELGPLQVMEPVGHGFRTTGRRGRRGGAQAMKFGGEK